MTTETPTPYTVADLRRWAALHRAWANNCYDRDEQPHAETYRAQAAAFDALADGIEECERGRDSYADRMTAYEIGRILRGEKP